METSEGPATPPSLINYFLHPQLRGNPDIQQRARILIFMLWMACVLIAISTLGIIVVPGNSKYLLPGMATNLSMIGLFVFLLFQLRDKGNYESCSSTSIAFFLTCIFIGVSITGGPAHSPFTQLLVVVPLMAYFLIGMRGGNITTIATSLGTIFLLVLSYRGFAFAQIFQPDQHKAALLMALLVEFLFIAMLAALYESTSESLREERNIEHQKVIQLALTDPLTGLVNRRTFDNEIAARISRSGKLNAPVSFAVCCIDLDGFKAINDCYGHDVGDQILRAVSIRLRSALHGTDVAGRHGGDEFMLLLDGLDNEAAIAANAKRLLKLISEPIETSSGLLSVGGSFGFAHFPEHASRIESLKQAADAAMYEAKHQQLGWKIFSPDSTAATP